MINSKSGFKIMMAFYDFFHICKYFSNINIFSANIRRLDEYLTDIYNIPIYRLCTNFRKYWQLFSNFYTFPQICIDERFQLFALHRFYWQIFSLFTNSRKYWQLFSIRLPPLNILYYISS